MEAIASPRTLAREKLKALIHYIAWRSSDPQKLGATKLNKILWFADMEHFVQTGQPLTGETYVKRQFGPAPQHVVELIEELEREGKLVVREPEVTYEPRGFIALVAPKLHPEFTADQISLVDAIQSEICYQHTARSISDATHDELWHLADLGEEIPYEAYLVTPLGEVTREDLDWGMESVGHGSRN